MSKHYIKFTNPVLSHRELLYLSPPLSKPVLSILVRSSSFPARSCQWAPKCWKSNGASEIPHPTSKSSMIHWLRGRLGFKS